MISLLWLLLAIPASPFKSKCQPEAKNVTLRHQVMILLLWVLNQSLNDCRSPQAI
jgi:hypothetical protein